MVRSSQNHASNCKECCEVGATDQEPKDAVSGDEFDSLPVTFQNGSVAVRASGLQFLKFLGPGLLMAVSFLDPGNLQADVQAGAQTGFALLWWFGTVTVVIGSLMQCMAGRLGIATGLDLAKHCGRRYSPTGRTLLWLLIEMAIIAADIQETVGSAQALHILSHRHVPLWAGCLIVSATAFVVLLLDSGLHARWLEALFGAAIGVEAVAMAVNFFRADIPAKQVFKGMFVPQVPSGSIPVLVGALGALVMPYNVFYHSALVNRREWKGGSKPTTGALLWYMRLETVSVLILAYAINLFVVCIFAYGFFNNPAYPLDSIGLEAAGNMLGQRFGPQFKYLWAVGLLAAGQISTIGLTSAGQIVMCGLLNMEVKGWVRYWGTRFAALVPTMLVATLSSASSAFDEMNQILNVVQSIMLPFALTPLVEMAWNSTVMGPAHRTKQPLFVAAAAVVLAVISINLYLLVDFYRSTIPQSGEALFGWVVVMVLYVLANAYFILGTRRVVAWVKQCRVYCQRRAYHRSRNASQGEFPAQVCAHLGIDTGSNAPHPTHPPAHGSRMSVTCPKSAGPVGGCGVASPLG